MTETSAKIFNLIITSSYSFSTATSSQCGGSHCINSLMLKFNFQSHTQFTARIGLCLVAVTYQLTHPFDSELTAGAASLLLSID